MAKRLRLMCDFETTTDLNDCRVWAVCAVNIDTLKVAYIGNSIEGFFDFLKGKNTLCLFHNLRFDGSFLLNYLFRNGYKLDNSMKAKSRKDKTFRTLISDTGAFYSIDVVFRKINDRNYEKVSFQDSFKKLPFKVAAIARGFGLHMSKGEIDYKAYRPVGHELTEEERDYIVRDCMIVAEALKAQYAEGLTKMTNASDAMGYYQKIIGKPNFDFWFPELPITIDDEIRRAYKGGFVYLNPNYKSVRGLQGRTYDVNSLYPSVMYDKILPYGYPVYFEGDELPDTSDNYPLYIVRMNITFELKPDHLPTLQLKNNPRYRETEYLTTSRSKLGNGEDDEPVEIFLTSVDYQLMMEHYDVTFYPLSLSEPMLYKGFRFKGQRDMFKEYIDYWMNIKENSENERRQIAKLQLNSLYGRFAVNPHGGTKEPYLDEDGVVRYKFIDADGRKPVYTAMGAFITAYAREKTIRSAQAVYERFVYSDTDSISVLGYDAPELDIHKSRLGAWKDEGRFCDSVFLRAKTYIKTVIYEKPAGLKNYARAMNTADGLETITQKNDTITWIETHVTCAGMPDNVKDEVTYDNFVLGMSFDGKLTPQSCAGGVVLKETTFTIK